MTSEAEQVPIECAPANVDDDNQGDPMPQPRYRGAEHAPQRVFRGQKMSKREAQKACADYHIALLECYNANRWFSSTLACEDEKKAFWACYGEHRGKLETNWRQIFDFEWPWAKKGDAEE